MLRFWIQSAIRILAYVNDRVTYQCAELWLVRIWFWHHALDSQINSSRIEESLSDQQIGKLHQLRSPGTVGHPFAMDTNVPDLALAAGAGDQRLALVQSSASHICFHCLLAIQSLLAPSASHSSVLCQHRAGLRQYPSSFSGHFKCLHSSNGPGSGGSLWKSLPFDLAVFLSAGRFEDCHVHLWMPWKVLHLELLDLQTGRTCHGRTGGCSRISVGAEGVGTICHSGHSCL